MDLRLRFPRRDPDQPLAAGEEGDELGRERGADIGEDCCQRDGAPDRNSRLGDAATSNQYARPEGQEEHMHQVHAVGQSGYVPHQGRTFFFPDAGEEQEGTEGGKQYVRRAELPGPLHRRGVDEHAGDGLVPEGPDTEEAAGQQAEQADADLLLRQGRD